MDIERFYLRLSPVFPIKKGCAQRLTQPYEFHQITVINYFTLVFPIDEGSNFPINPIPPDNVWGSMFTIGLSLISGSRIKQSDKRKDLLTFALIPHNNIGFAEYDSSLMFGLELVAVHPTK